ncbi:hypothetical protein evm_007253 [Chilo suppressalis]|nr:hypothetical protein evm_007253 [Chilo suppressalis]
MIIVHKLAHSGSLKGYSNRDEADICKHYKGGPEKTCFKGTRCNKKHVRKHPDGWTLDRVEVPVKIRSLPLPPLDSWHRVLVTYVCHFDRLYVQFVNNEQDDPVPSFGIILPPATLTALVRDMNSPASRMAYKQLTISPALGELVAALYPLDNQWYRARVLTVSRSDQNIEVMYVDYGNVVWVKEDQIRVLDPCYLSLPTQAVRCVLAGVFAKTTCSKQWVEAKTALARMAQDRTLDAHIVGRDYDELIVELFDDEGYSIAEQLAAHDVIELREYVINDDTKTTHKIVPA